LSNVIDSLTVALGLDPSNFTKGQKEAVRSLRATEAEATRTAKAMEIRGKQAAEFFSKIRNEVIALTAAFMGANSIKQFAERITASDAALGRLAHNVGMTTKDLSAWEGAVERAGGSSSGMAGSIQSLTQQIQQLKTTGNAGFLQPLAMAHVDMMKFIDDATPMGDKLLLLADAFKGLSPERAQFLGAGMGLDQGTINLLMQGRQAVEALLQKQREMNAVNQADADAAIARQNSWNNLQDTFENFGRTILTEVSPAIVDVLAHMQNWVQTNKAWIESGIIDAIRQFAEWLKNIDWAQVQKNIQEFTLRANDAATAVGGWVKVGETLFALWIGSKFLAVLANVGILKTAFLGAGGAGAGLLGRLGIAGAAAIGGQELINALDPSGSWMDRNIPGVSAADNWLWEKTGGWLGRSNEAQTNAAAGSYKESERDINQLTRLGWTRAQAIGIAANIQAESAGNASAIGDSGEAYGLIQWHAPRQAAFAKWAGHDIRQSTREEQIAFINQELRSGSAQKAGQMMMKSQSASEVAALYSRYGVIPKDVMGEMMHRSALTSAWGASDPSLRSGAGAGLPISGNASYPASNSSSEVSIGQIIVNTLARDANGIAQSIGGAITNYTFAAHGDPGVH
jgi:Phage tail lysozyme